MITNIISIGKALRENGEDKTNAELWIKDNKPMDLAVVVDISDNNDNIDVYIKEFEEDMYIQSLFYQQGNDLRKGSGVCVHNAKELTDSSLGKKHESANKSFDKKLNYSFEFLEIDKKIIKKCKERIIEEISEDTGKTYFVMITQDDKTPYELHRKKFEESLKLLWKTSDKLSNSVKQSVCHNCLSDGKSYDTAIYKFYNNDKEAYSNIYNDIGKDVFAFGLCESCIADLLNGKQYIHENMTARWLDTNIMFIPYELTKSVRKIYENGLSEEYATANSEYAQDKLLKNLYRHESNVFSELSEMDVITDILFFEVEQSAWKIQYSIQGVLPSRFGKLGEVLSKYEQVINHNDKKEFLFLKDVFEFALLGHVQESDDKSKTNNKSKSRRIKKIVPKEKIRLVNALLKGNAYNKTLLYRSMLKEYKEEYLESLKSSSSYLRPIAIRKMNKIYNIFSELGCLDSPLELVEKNDKGGYKMITFKNREELFERNKKFFDCDEKKAWFILGELYSNAIYASKEYYKTDEKSSGDDNDSENKKESRKSHLESAFLFDKKFDYTTFYQLSDKIKMQFIKYGRLNAYESLFAEMKHLMASKTPISQEEAKYIFFWGMESFFTDNVKNNKDSKDNKDNKIEKNNENVEENDNE